MTKIFRKIGSNSGLAQIPLVIGLLIMAVAIPVATKLSQQSQDTRNQAAGCVSTACNLNCVDMGFARGYCEGTSCKCSNSGGSPTSPPTHSCTWYACTGPQGNKKCAERTGNFPSSQECPNNEDGCKASNEGELCDLDPTAAPVNCGAGTETKCGNDCCNNVTESCTSSGGAYQCACKSGSPKCGDTCCNSTTHICNNNKCELKPTPVPPTAVADPCSLNKNPTSCSLQNCLWIDNKCVKTGKSCLTHPYTGSNTSGSWVHGAIVCNDVTSFRQCENGVWKTVNCAQGLICKAGKTQCEEATPGQGVVCPSSKEGVKVCVNGVSGVSKTYRCISGKWDQVETCGTKCDLDRKECSCVLGKPCTLPDSRIGVCRSTGAADGSAKCQADPSKWPAGSDCTDDPDCISGKCTFNHCEKLLVGQMCTAGGSCETGICDYVVGITGKRCVDPTGKIGNLGKGGASCVNDKDCNSGKCSANHCTPLLVGQNCNKQLPKECVTEKCEWATTRYMCVDPSGKIGDLKKGGEACKEDVQCNSGKCTSDRCEPHAYGSCSWFGSYMSNGETSCFNAADGVASQKVSCVLGKASVISTYIGRGCQSSPGCIIPNPAGGCWFSQTDLGKLNECSAVDSIQFLSSSSKANVCNAIGIRPVLPLHCQWKNNSCVPRYDVNPFTCKIAGVSGVCTTANGCDGTFDQTQAVDCGGPFGPWVSAFGVGCCVDGSIPTKTVSKPTSTPTPMLTKTMPKATLTPRPTVAPCTKEGQKECFSKTIRKECVKDEERGGLKWGYFGCEGDYLCNTIKNNGICEKNGTPQPPEKCSASSTSCLSETYRRYCDSNKNWQKEWCENGCDLTTGKCKSGEPACASSGIVNAISQCCNSSGVPTEIVGGIQLYRCCVAGTTGCNVPSVAPKVCIPGAVQYGCGKKGTIVTNSGERIDFNCGLEQMAIVETNDNCVSKGSCKNSSSCRGVSTPTPGGRASCVEGTSVLTCGEKRRVTGDCEQPVTFNCASNQVGILEVSGDCRCKATCKNSSSCVIGETPTAIPTSTGDDDDYCKGVATGCGSCYVVAGTCVKTCTKCDGQTRADLKNWWKECPGGCSSLSPTAKPTSGGGGGVSCKQCPTDFKCYTDGEEYRWFVAGYVMQGFNLVTDTTKMVECGGVAKPSYKGKTKGDANCDGFVDGYDYSVWRKEYVDISRGEPVTRTNWEADFTGNNGVCDGVVDGADYSLWRKYYNDLNGGVN